MDIVIDFEDNVSSATPTLKVHLYCMYREDISLNDRLQKPLLRLNIEIFSLCNTSSIKLHNGAIYHFPAIIHLLFYFN